MDRQNLFGAFTESFDIMRDELRKARIAEAEANASKKELVAKLSYDIKTPVASIKAASEVGAALTDNEKIRDNYAQIIRKADQINTLVTNLFTATLEELQKLSVTPEDIASGELITILGSADYLHRAKIPAIPDCLFYADKLRLQQVFDNIFVNSYKYANTKIDIRVNRDNACLAVSIEDYGGGVPAEELPLLKEKFKQGSNIENMEGAGLGLYISDYFMQEMEAQRVGIVRALINSPEILFADEPTGVLNSKTGLDVLDMLTKFNEQGQSVVMVTHDMRSARRGNQILYLSDGAILGECDLGRYGHQDKARHEKLSAFLTEMGW